MKNFLDTLLSFLFAITFVGGILGGWIVIFALIYDMKIKRKSR